jgi:hypothetical protein
MACPTTPLSCLDPINIFAGVYKPKCAGFGDPSSFQAERAIFKSNYEELINNYGVDLDYYINGFDINEMNIVYGEHTLQEYSGPVEIRAYLELEEGMSLSRYGWDSDDLLTAYISIDIFRNSFIDYIVNEQGFGILDEFGEPLTTDSISLKFYRDRGQRIEPKCDDLMKITSLGCDRPGDRGAKIFRITQVLDQSIQDGLNPMMGHYVWKITAKRYETSHETNAPQELGNEQVYDNTYSGKLSSTLFPSLTTSPKVYSENVDNLSETIIYNMEKNDVGIYGNYY